MRYDCKAITRGLHMLAITVALSATCLVATKVFAQPSGYPGDDYPYVPNPFIFPEPDVDHFPSGIDGVVYDRALATMERFDDHKSRGRVTGSRYAIVGTGTNERLDEHEWHESNGGRDFLDGVFDWFDDSDILTGWIATDEECQSDSDCDEDAYVRFTECIEVREVLPFSPHCSPSSVRIHSSCNSRRNAGYIVEFWWPEFQIELNDFGIAALNPIDFPPNGLDLNNLYDDKEFFYDEIYLPDYIELDAPGNWDMDDQIPSPWRNFPHFGNQDWAGFIPGDHTYQTEAHTWKTNMNHAGSIERNLAHGHWDLRYHENSWGLCYPDLFWYNGYQKGNSDCFYNVLNERGPVMAGWTEEIGNQLFWRLPAMSTLKNFEYYAASVPLDMDDDLYMTDFSCGSYRADQWPDPYLDLLDAANIFPNNLPPLDRICYRGGGQLYPLIGSLSGNFSSLTGEAYLVRRAIELMSSHNFLWTGQRMPLFSDRNDHDEGDVQDSIDKIQRIYPIPSKCFRMNEIHDHYESGSGSSPLFPKDDIGDESLGSRRYAYWNKRMASFCEYRGIAYHVEEADNDPDSYLFGWGCTRYPLNDLGIVGEGPETGFGDFVEGEIWGLEPLLGWTDAFDFEPYAEAISMHYPFARTFSD